MKTRCGIVGIIGEPNAGKSTLINAVVGQKISIVTPKVQTTRFNVRGVMSEDKHQIVFIDTPGIFDAPEKFEKAMVKAAWAGAGDADCILLLIDARKGLTENLESVLKKLATFSDKPVFAAINKVDKADKEKLLHLADALAEHKVLREIFFISALKQDGLQGLLQALKNTLPEGPFLYPEDSASDIQLRMLAAEITREKLFLMMSQELPYASLVETEKWDETTTLVTISQIIYVQREAHKKMVIGDKGAMIKRIGSSSRRELEKMLEKKVHLALFVKVREKWKEEGETYRLLGLDG